MVRICQSKRKKGETIFCQAAIHDWIKSIYAACSYLFSLWLIGKGQKSAHSYGRAYLNNCLFIYFNSAQFFVFGSYHHRPQHISTFIFVNGDLIFSDELIQFHLKWPANHFISFAILMKIDCPMDRSMRFRLQNSR